MELKYRSETNRPKQHQYAQGGFSKEIKKYEDLINDKTGKLETQVTDIENFYEKIQSHKDSQLLESIIKRYEIDIDKKQIKEIHEDIVDLTAVPETMTEAYAIIKKIENDFENRPAEIKRAFNNNIGEYVAGVTNGRLKEIVEAYQGKNKKSEKVEATKIEASKNEPIVNQATIEEIVKKHIENTIGGGNTNV